MAANLQGLEQPLDPTDYDVSAEIAWICSEHFPYGLISATDVAIRQRRAKIIYRDPANDDVASAELQT